MVLVSLQDLSIKDPSDTPEALNLAEAQVKPDTLANDDKNIEQKVTPWDVNGAVVEGQVQAIDYQKLIKQFGVQPITPELIDRFERVTSRKAHLLIRRGVFFAHRDLDRILDLHEQGKPFFLYT